MGQSGDGAVRPISAEKYNLLVWTDYEKLFRNRPNLRNKQLVDVVVPFTLALRVKLRRSVLGTYLKYFNEGQWQDEALNFNKLALTETITSEYDQSKKDQFEYNNNLFDDTMQFLKDTITETQEIDCSFLHQHVTHLRLDDYSINFVDDGLSAFKNLQVLILCGNWLEDINGCVLPRTLRFLELFANSLNSVKKLSVRPPQHLLHLGLGRNKLSDDSSLHLLVESGRFNRLKSLDLSECDIYNLEDVLTRISSLPNLETLQLQGNPCSMVTGYKDIILNTFPNLLFLDGSNITPPDRELPENFSEGAKSATFVLICSQLKGLPPPPKADKKIKQTVHVELVLPLFQDDTKEEREDFESSDQPTDRKSDKKSKKGGKKGGKKVGKSIYEQKDEYNPRLKNNSIKTERRNWSANMNFAPVLLQSPENNLFAHRDSCRSRVNVRIVYLKVLSLETKKKKGGKGKKNKKDKKKSSKTSSKSDVKKDQGKKQPTEVVQKRITLAQFHCNLTTLNWKDQGLVFYWTNTSEFGSTAKEYQSYLQALRKEEEAKRAKLEALKKKHAEKKAKKGKKSKGSSKTSSKKSTKSSKKSKGSKKSKKDSVPVSCFVTFDLARIGKEIKTAKGGGEGGKKKSKKGKKQKKKK